MSASAAPTRDEIELILKRMGITNVTASFVERCIEVNTRTRATAAMLPSAPDKSVEPAHVFAPPLPAQ